MQSRVAKAAPCLPVCHLLHELICAGSQLPDCNSNHYACIVSENLITEAGNYVTPRSAPRSALLMTDECETDGPRLMSR